MSAWTRRINVAALTVAVGLALVDIAGGVKAFNSPRGLLNGVPFLMHFFIAGVMILADWRCAHHEIRRAAQQAASGAAFVANVLRAVYRGRIIFLDP